MMDFGVFEVLLSLAAILIITYVCNFWNYEYWNKRGVSGPKATVPFGNFAEIFFRRKPMCIKLDEIYKYNDHSPIIGYFAGNQPVLMIKDPEIIKDVLIKDFNVFAGRGLTVNENVDPLSAHLFNIDGQRWKILRQKLTPSFTSGKLRNMFGLMYDCADTFELNLKSEVARNNYIDCREQTARYTTDVIGSCAFGIDTKALADENSVFRKVGRKIFESNFRTQFKRLLRQILPRLYEFFHMTLISPEITKFFIDTMKETVEMRKIEKTTRNDFIDLLMQIPKDTENDGFEWTNNILTAQAFVFFAAGFETSSTTISFALWELARTPEVQEKLRREILKYENNEGLRVTYDIVNEMKYLDMVIRETLRKNPPGIALMRKAMENYRISGTNVDISAGQSILIPVYSLHRDPKYFPKPEIFDPERFNDEAKRLRHPMVFLPFGDGPKNCIGLRFAYLQVKLALIKILKNFRIEPATNIDEPYIIDKSAVILSPVNSIVLKFVPLKK